MVVKEHIIEAVIDEFNEKGLKFTMDDIAKRLGISKRTLYTEVKDKEALFIEAVNYVFEAIKKSEQVITKDESLDIVEKLRRILIVLPEKYKRIEYRQLYDLKEKYPRIYAKIEHRLETDWEPTFSILEQAMAKGRIKKINPQIFQSIVSGTIEYYLSRTFLIENHITYEEALEQMLDIIMNGIIERRS